MSASKKIKALEETVKALRAHEKAEAAFKKMTKAEKRVAIAKDVIANLKTRQLKPLSGTYFSIAAGDEFDLQTALAKGAECTVCALGGLFACAVPYKNGDMGAVDIHNGMVIINYLRGIFEKKQLDLIETAFEKKLMGDPYPFATREAEQNHPAVRFGKKYPGHKARMAAIMQNIIKNEGTFKPELG